jgi:hypothetical protein
LLGLLTELLNLGLVDMLVTLIVELVSQLAQAGLLDIVVTLVGLLLQSGLLDIVVGLVTSLIDTGLLDVVVTLVEGLLDTGLLDAVVGLLGALLDAGLLEVVLDLVNVLLDAGLVDQVLELVDGLLTQLLDAGLLDSLVDLVGGLIDAGLLDSVLALVGGLLEDGLLDDVLALVGGLLDAGLLEQVTALLGGLLHQLLEADLLDQVLALVDGLLDAGLLDAVTGLVGQLLEAGLLDQVLALVDGLLEAGAIQLLIDTVVGQQLLEQLVSGLLGASLDGATTDLLRTGLLDPLFMQLFGALGSIPYGYAELQSLGSQLVPVGLLDPAVLEMVTTPSAPRGLSAGAGDRQVSLTWNRPADNGGLAVTGYRARCVPQDSSLPIRQADTADRTVTVGGLRNGTRYTCRVRAQNAAGWGPLSSGVHVRPIGPPTRPRSLTGTAGDRRAHLRWTRPANNGGLAITSYRARCVPHRSDLPVRRANTSNRSVTVTRLTNGARYDCQVRARNGVGFGPWSAKVTVRPVR